MGMHAIRALFTHPGLRTKLLWVLAIVALYRMLVFVPIPFVDIDALLALWKQPGNDQGGLEFLSLLLGGSLQYFSIIAVGLIPYINASIILQLLTVVLPQLEELQQQGEIGTKKIQQYTRLLTFPLAFVQSIGSIFLMKSMLVGVISISPFTVIMSALVMTVGSMILLWFGELVTEKGLSNGVSIIIFASIVSGMVTAIGGVITSNSATLASIAVFILVIVVALIVLSILLIKTMKEIPIVYSRQGGLQETSFLPIPLNPVGMIPIIFAISFVSFPYLFAQLVQNINSPNQTVMNVAERINVHLNITSQNPHRIAILVFFVLIVVFTFFYTMVVFNPQRIADTVQQRGGFIPGIRPGDDTATYLGKVLGHLSLWGGIGLAIIGVYSYLIVKLPIVSDQLADLGQLPILVQGSGIIIIVGVVQDIVNKVKAELLMSKYDTLE